MGDNMLKAGDIIEGTVLEVKAESVVIKFGRRAIEASCKAELEEGEKIKVKIKGWYNGKLLLKVLNKNDGLGSNSIDIRV
ncbi:hypothetical protein BX659_11916 [Orenia metallireducens]|jgi:ribosomal protein S1|uniref:S1 motif domain-containing protein n=1 Tax=Orenia metallireducens TaxID=1413210 RepID=A0A285HMF0_9FIRM|nr:hypothetical protein [Orenia metallireducens]PRX26652.1 hypothetical protein BX659_11916 [Orenia metallireducens]SNY35861.1 hypothetical protein SAMN06265827_12016 [Orenia metallireducens]